MKKAISDEDLVLLYYGEHEDASLASTVAEDNDLSDRYEAIAAELTLLNEHRVPERDVDYALDVWHGISSQLDAPDPVSRTHWWQQLLRPRLSLAGTAGLMLVVLVAFQLGRQQTPQSSVPVAPPMADIGVIDTDRLLSQSVSRHLEELNVGFTEFVRTGNGNDAAWATDMLVANRLYRQAASNEGNAALARLLTGLEPLLIELAYESHKKSTDSRKRMQQEISEGLLFRIRVMNQQLNQPEVST